MKKKIVIVSALAVVGLVGIYLSLTQEGAIKATNNISANGQGEVTEDQVVVSTLGSQNSVNSEGALTEQILLTTEEISVIQERSKQVSSELDSLTKELDAQLENPEKRKSIQAQYQQLADEQNMLAIQLVKANQSQMAEE